MYYKFSEIPIRLLITIVMALTYTSSIAAETLPEIQKPPITLQASDVLPKDLLKGPNYQIKQTVKNDGFINTYVLKTDYGRLTVESTALLMIRINELKAIHHMGELRETSAFKETFKASAKGPLKTVKGIVTSPVDTVKGTGTGVGRWFSDAGRSIVKSDPHQEGPLKTIIGYGVSKRIYAFEYGVDPYTSYVPLQKILNEIAWYSTAGGLIPKVLFKLIPAPAGTAVGLSGTASGMKQLVRDNSPAQLNKINKKKLKVMGVQNAVANDFLQNPYYSPQERTLLVGELESMKGTEGRENFIAFASQANDESVARFMRLRAQMMGMYSAFTELVVNIIEINGVPFLQRKDGLVVGLFPLDYIPWTALLWHKEKIVSEAIEKLPGVTGKELWIEGTVDPVARKALEERGWKVEDKVRDKLIKKQP